MTLKDKVIAGLTVHFSHDDACRKCPYVGKNKLTRCFEKLSVDAIYLLTKYDERKAAENHETDCAEP